jgi:hypothetical protein
MRKLLMSTALSTVLFGSGQAHANDIRHYYGSWETLQALDTNGKPQCAAITRGPERMFAVKMGVAQSLFFHVWKQSWNIPDGTQVNVRVQVDNAPVVQYPMTGFRNPQGGSMLEYTFNNHTNPRSGEHWYKEFLDMLRTGREITIFFDGNEGSWKGSLAGSEAAMHDMGRCIVETLGTPGTTQPYTGVTQPYTNLPDTSRTQPYLEH